MLTTDEKRAILTTILTNALAARATTESEFRVAHEYAAAQAGAMYPQEPTDAGDPSAAVTPGTGMTP